MEVHMHVSPETEHHMIAAFESGRGVECYRAIDTIPSAVHRRELEKDLISLLRPSLHAELDSSKGDALRCAVIVGEQGTGKSTAVRKFIRSIPGPKGVVYCNVPGNTQTFSTKLRRLLGYEKHSTHNSLLREEDPEGLWMALRGPLLEAAKGYKKKHSRAMVLVIDSADRLARHQPNLLTKLQEFASTCSATGSLRVVFMSSDGAALAHIRAGLPPPRRLELFEVGHLSEGEAEVLLMDHGVPREVATVVVHTITGGSFSAIKEFLSRYDPSEPDSVSSLVLHLERRVLSSVRAMNIQIDSEFFKLLVARPTICSTKATKLLMEDQINNLVRHNIITLHPRGFYRFHARYVGLFFKTQMINIQNETSAFVNFIINFY
jgi:hypothetical protein